MNPAKPTLVFYAILVLTVLSYYSGLNSRFVLDDIYNLQGLGEMESQGLWYYLFGSGFSGPTGRPVSLLSFALQYNHWPDSPFAFKLVNLILHAVNGALVFVLCIRLYLQVYTEKSQAYVFALLAAGLWLLHPIQVNTVMYTVQRMTEISAFFTLLGFIAYLHGRSLMATGRLSAGLVWAFIAIYGCTSLAVLGKENGILLPLFLMILEFILLSGGQRYAIATRTVWTMLLLPVVLFISYLGLIADSLVANFVIRDFTPGERVLTEFTVLINYLKVILFPHPGAFGLYHDGYQVSRSLITPLFTLVSILMTGGLLAVSILWRKKYPLLSTGILIFFAGHLLEAGPFSLDLYYEHRNYLPLLGVMIAISWIATSLLKSKNLKIPVVIFLGIYSLSLTAITRDQVWLWSEPELQLNQWLKYNPESRWTRQDLATLYIADARYDAAEEVLKEHINKHNRDIYPYIRLMHLYSCRTDRSYQPGEMEDAYAIARSGVDYNLSTLSALDYLVLDILKNQCTNVNLDHLEILILMLIDSSGALLDTGILFELLSSISLYRDDLNNGLMYIRESLSRRFGVDRKLREIAILGLMNNGMERKKAIEELKAHLERNVKAKLAYHDIVNNLN